MAEMDHEPTHSASDQSIGSRSSLQHRITNGYEICVHTCTESGCVSKKTKTILWNKEGHAVRKHAHNPRLHPRCTKSCPGQRLINRTNTNMRPEGGRDATNREVAAHIGTMGEDVYPPTTANRCYHIIYIPDAAMKIVSKEKAQNDLGFIPATLSESEYEPLQEFKGSIHVISKNKAKHSNAIILKVIMQEWVSVFL
jgi:hypothetical protein